MKTFALRFISGKYQGGEFLLPPNQDVVVGRASDLDMVLVEDMVSRRHATISVNGDQVLIQDLGSTNGTFVNGERVKRAQLNEGDRVLIGTSIIKLVTADSNAAPASSQMLEQVAAHRSTSQVRSMSGTIDEVPLPDLLQLFGSSKKTGVLVVRSDADTGKIFLEKGFVVYASVNDRADLPAQKSAYRIVTWQHGTFYMEPVEHKEFPHRIELSSEGVLMEAMRLIDEVRRVQDLPPMRGKLALTQPLQAPLRDLAPDELDVLQAAINHPLVESVFNNSARDDIATAQHLASLVRAGYLQVTQPE